MASSVTYTSRLRELGRTQARRAAEINAEFADRIVAGARQRSRVDTGEMRDGWQRRVINQYAAEVVNPVEHAVYNEFGTVHLPAQPMLAPSVEAERGPFLAAVAAALEGR